MPAPQVSLQEKIERISSLNELNKKTIALLNENLALAARYQDALELQTQELSLWKSKIQMKEQLASLHEQENRLNQSLQKLFENSLKLQKEIKSENSFKAVYALEAKLLLNNQVINLTQHKIAGLNMQRKLEKADFLLLKSPDIRTLQTVTEIYKNTINQLSDMEQSLKKMVLMLKNEQPLIAYLIFAYKVNVSETYGGLMRRLPEWAVTDRFDIQAKSVNQNATKDQMRLMMQSLLEERFKLAVHREMRQVPVFALTLVKLGKTGPQLKQHDPASSCSTTPSDRSAPIASLVGLWPAQCGDAMEIWAPDAPRHLRSGGRNMSMDAIASWLSGTYDSDLPIVDHSDLTGKFDFIIEFEPEHPESANVSNTPVEGPAFLDALKDQLGLQLKKQMGSASFFNVDHVEFPSAN